METTEVSLFKLPKVGDIIANKWDDSVEWEITRIYKITGQQIKSITVDVFLVGHPSNTIEDETFNLGQWYIKNKELDKISIKLGDLV